MLLCYVPVPGSSLSIITDTSFEALKDAVSERTLSGIKDMGHTHMTEIQSKAVPPLLAGR